MYFDMWNTGTVGSITVYCQRTGDRKYEIHYSDRIELIVRDASRSATHYFDFDGRVARDQSQRIYDEEFVEETVAALPELDTLPEKIKNALRAVKKISKPEPIEPT